MLQRNGWSNQHIAAFVQPIVTIIQNSLFQFRTGEIILSIKGYWEQFINQDLAFFKASTFITLFVFLIP